MAFSPANRTQAQLRQDVANCIQGVISGDTELTSAVDSCLSAAVGRLNTRDWKRLLTSMTITLTADDFDYALPTTDDYRSPAETLRMNAAGKRDGKLYFKEQRTLHDERPSAATSGDPAHYSIDHKNRLFLLSMPPSSSFVGRYPTLQHWYFPRVADVVTAGLTTPPEFDWFVVYWAGGVLRTLREPATAGAMFQLARDQWDVLVASDNATQTDWSED